MKLIVTEKPSVGRSIAAALGIKEKKDGYMEGLNAIVTWCIGHLVDLAPAELYDITYPRTDSNYLTEDMRGRLSGLADVVTGANLCTAGLHLAVHPDQVIDSSKVSDHHAMIPTDRIMHINTMSLPAGEGESGNQIGAMMVRLERSTYLVTLLWQVRRDNPMRR